MTESRWRDHARPIIARVLEETEGQSEKEIRAALREAYPFGQRAYHPYKIWCSEIAVQRGQKKLGKFGPKRLDSCEGQLDLFTQEQTQ